jgi:hypothetical protein
MESLFKPVLRGLDGRWYLPILSISSLNQTETATFKKIVFFSGFINVPIFDHVNYNTTSHGANILLTCLDILIYVTYAILLIIL